jgi:hypothetical protein
MHVAFHQPEATLHSFILYKKDVCINLCPRNPIKNTMKTLAAILMLFAGLAAAQAEGGEKPSKDTNQKRMEVNMPSLKAIIEYTGGDTLFVFIESEGPEKVQLKLVEGNTTLLNDGLQNKEEQQRVYVISQLPEGEYKIRLKKGNYVVEKTITKHTPQTPGE